MQSKRVPERSKPVEFLVHRGQVSIDQLAQRTQRVIVRDALLQRRLAEQLVLFEVESTPRLGLAEKDAAILPEPKGLAFFNGLLDMSRRWRKSFGLLLSGWDDAPLGRHKEVPGTNVGQLRIFPGGFVVSSLRCGWSPDWKN